MSWPFKQNFRNLLKNIETGLGIKPLLEVGLNKFRTKKGVEIEFKLDSIQVIVSKENKES